MRFILRRVATYLVALWVAVTVNFLIPRLIPGNAVDAMMARYPNLTPSAERALDVLLGVGKNNGTLIHQYFVYMGNLAHGDLGVSLSQFPSSVSSLIGSAMAWTIVLVGTATVISFLLGTMLGILAGWKRGGWFDRVLPALSFLQATPYFFLALILIDAFALHYKFFPAEGKISLLTQIGFNWTFVSDAFAHAALPAITLIVTSMAGWMLQMRNVMITTIGEDYVLAAQAKGLSSRRVVFTYAARNAILPNLAGFALALGFVVAGALIMELVFSYQGLGYLLYQAVTSDDGPLMQGVFLVIAIAVLAASLIADAVYVIADPRARTRAAY
jgi:peptide/nickel transport system permease protein